MMLDHRWILNEIQNKGEIIYSKKEVTIYDFLMYTVSQNSPPVFKGMSSD